MGCRNREFVEHESAVPPSLSDALLFTTMCIIDFPVEVHVKDGSIYSGILHTARVEDDYGIVMKKARMTKKGNGDANIASGDLIETLVVLSEDLVQVIAKGILLPTNSGACDDTGNNVGDVASKIPSLEDADRVVKIKKSNKTTTMQASQTRRPSQSENGIAQGSAPTIVRDLGNALKVGYENSGGIHSAKKEEAPDTLVNGRQVEDGRSHRKQFDYEERSNFEKEETTCEIQCSGSSLVSCFTQSKQIRRDTESKLLLNGAPSDQPASSVVKLSDQCHERQTSGDSSRKNAISFGVSTSGSSFVEGTPEPHVSSSSTPIDKVHPKSSTSISKESKLNPGAQVFCPSFANHRSVTPPAVQTVANVAYIPDSFPVVPIASSQPEVEVSPFIPRSSPPVKFVPYGNLIAGNDVSDYSQPIIGHVGGRTLPARYAGQHQSIQAGFGYMHPNSQNVMVGRLGQLVYMHPVSQDVIHMNQGVAAFSQLTTRPLLSPHQGHLPKHQGSATAQALQLYGTPPFIAGGQQPFTVQSHIPLLQPPFPVIRPISVPGSNGIYSTKFQ